MFSDQPNPSDEPMMSGTPSEEAVPIQDNYEADDTAEQVTVGEDDPSLLDRSSRALEASADDSGPSPQPEMTPRSASVGAGEESGSDMAMVPSESAAAAIAGHSEQTGDWENERSAHHVAVELRRIESNVRALLEERDPKRKRKLSGTHRWNELEDDLLMLRFSGRFDEDTLRRLQELITRRHYLFRRLRFLASTRPTWNT